MFAGIAVFIVVVVAAFLYFGATAGVEAILKTRAQEENKDTGEMIESILRYEGSEPDGSRLVRRFALVEDWEERIDPEMLALLGGRRKLLNPRQRAHTVQLYRSGQHTVNEIYSLMGISRATLYAYVEESSKQA